MKAIALRKPAAAREAMAMHIDQSLEKMIKLFSG